eukprot:jgi/Tetstr1/453655/TSEL_040611.t1
MTDLGIKLGGMAVKVIFLLLRRPAPGRPFRASPQPLLPGSVWAGGGRPQEDRAGALTDRGPPPLRQVQRTSCPGPQAAYMASAVTGMYVSFKVQMLWDRLPAVRAGGAATATRCEAQYGQYATADEVMEAGGSCSICQESMSNPLRLSCKHIFCEECVTEWFERERTCPLCRAVVKPPASSPTATAAPAAAPQLF